MKIFGFVLMAAVMLPWIARGDAQYYRALDGQEVYYTRGNAIFRRADGQQLYYLRDNRIYRFSDNTPLYTITEDTISHVDGHELYTFREGNLDRISNGRHVYYVRNNAIYRHADGRKVLYFRGEDAKLIVFMVIMLEEAKTPRPGEPPVRL